MARIACLSVPDLSVAALVRVRPELDGTAFAVADGRAAASRVLAVSERAGTAGVRVGMTAAQARTICDAVVVVPHAPEAVRAAANALADVAATLGPRVEIAADGTVYLDCQGTAALCATEIELAGILAARARRQGLAAHVGVASSKLAAWIAARDGGGVRVVTRAEEAAYLAPLPIALLEPDASTAATLASWGVSRIGELTALPAGDTAHRLGPTGARLLRRARGDDDAVLSPRPAPTTVVEVLALEYGIDRLEPLLFVLRRLVDALTGRLALSGLACAGLELTLALETGTPTVRRIMPAAPTADPKVLLTLLRAHLEQQPAAAAITAVRLSAAAARLRTTQLDLFRPNGPSAVALAATIARLAALCGADRVGRPVRVDSHRPDAVAVGAFTTEHVADGQRRATNAPTSASATRIALRAFRPPTDVEVFESAGRLEYVRGRGFGGRVVQLAGPWRLRGEWWTADPFVREYYDVELTDGGLYRIYHDGRTHRWVADGMYD